MLPASPFLLIDEVHHLPEIAEKVNDKRLSINYFHKQIQQLEEPNQLFDRIQSYLPKEHEALRWLSIYREELFCAMRSTDLYGRRINEFSERQAT